MSELSVKVWQEKVMIPTYDTGQPDKNPMFFEKRVYQGSNGVVYPNPVIEKIYDEKKDKEYNGLFLENEYLKIMILPELGGRVQMAYDKIRQRHFIYYNQVIKPALVGLCGPWISGGIEFNWPQHHRPSTFEPVDFSLEEHADGSKTVWVNEVERMFRTRGMAGFTLYPGKAYLEINVKLLNRTPLPQTFLWWANPAVKVNDEYQSVFPPDVNAVFDHGKRDVSAFPIATGTYYKVDYSPGTDISRYKNIPVPTSYMAIHSDYDFVGGYEHDSKAGLLHVANHHVSPGKKQWTWGHSDFGRAWDRNLTDEDGPYIELMTGVYTDNQPDFSWLMPHEEKSFVQYFMPYRELGVIKNATKDILVNIEKVEDEFLLKVFATSNQPGITIKLTVGDEILLHESAAVSPERIYTRRMPAAKNIAEKDILLIISDIAGKELLRYEPAKNKSHEFPRPATAPPAPARVANNEQLYLAGLHLEQYRHATYDPVLYYEEALHRDAGDIRNNNALGALYIRRGQFAKSEPYFRMAIETLTQRNPNPYDGEAYYNLGLCLKMQLRQQEAYDAFYKACWNSAWQDNGYFSLAQIDMANGEYEKALDHIQRSLDRNASNSKAYVIKVAALRKICQFEKAMAISNEALQRDHFNLGALFELYKILNEQSQTAAAENAIALLKSLARDHVQNYIEYALDYQAAGLYHEAIELMQLFLSNNPKADHPMVWYYLAWWHHQCGKPVKTKEYLDRGASANPDYCFPNRLEDIAVLQLATALNPEDAKAPFYLGNLWYDKRQYKEAIVQWELSVSRDDHFSIAFRNLGLANFNKKNEKEKALAFFEKAFSLNSADARVLMELDQLRKRLNAATDQRLQQLEEHRDIVALRDDLYLERAALYNFSGRYEEAYSQIVKRRFHPWEGGEGKVSGQYIYSLVEMAKENIGKGDCRVAIGQLEQAQQYPDNLGEGKLFGAMENDIFYWLAIAYERGGEPEKANIFLRKATEGLSEPTAAMFYNDQPPDKIFYQGLAWKKLGKKEKANVIFNKLVEYGKTHMNDEVKIDYFAVSLPDLLIFEDDLGLRNKIHCLYMTALGYLGLNELVAAAAAFEQALAEDNMHFGARTHLNMVNKLETRNPKLEIRS